MIVHFSESFSHFASLLLLIAAIPHVVFALQNVTISHTSSSIDYKPNSSIWFSSDSALDYSQSHATTETKGASATFTFTGIAIYYAAASWPYPVSANISINGGSGTFVDLHDYQSAQTNGGSASASATIHWYRTGLKNTSHTIVISLAKNASYAVLDTLIYTIDDGSDNTDESPIWPIILGSVLGGLVVIGAIVGLVFYRRRQKEKNAQPMWDGPVLDNLMTPLVTTQAAELHPLVTSDHDNAHSNYPLSSSAIRPQTTDSSFLTESSQYGRYSDQMSSSQVQFVEGSSSSRVISQVRSRYPDEKKATKPDVVFGVANPETEDIPPPAYSEHHEH
ncbi:hypothetical protein J3R30DRAFT_703445 [Lentinula aciculospora]|uniref:Transmembrane protein n=1 Tax=Lentinula aciculospora TaxID=153920 RepID=A0A9W9A3H6_9AGAR|nr:hypothetical protein J3R30DRAFT_703445 [Lentinula aciculospora]